MVLDFHRMSEYERIKAACAARGQLWEDPDFPASQASVFYYQTPPFHFVWKRAKDIYENATFILDKSEIFDVVPGKMGDKWLVSCLGVLFLCKGLFYRVVPADQKMDADYAGVFRFRIWWCGQWVEVVVDDRLPTHNDRLAFLQHDASSQLWAALLEKAYAKLHGSYEALKYGSVVNGLAELTGGVADSRHVLALDAPLLRDLLALSNIVTVFHMPPRSKDKLEPDMNYMICELREVDAADGKVALVRLHRPTASEDTVTHLVFDHDTWRSIPIRERERLTAGPRGFWMLLSDLKQLFPRVETVYLDRDTGRAEPSLAHRATWNMNMYHGSWRRGVNAGGCRNHVDFFHMNPQIQIEVSEPDTVVLALNQHCVIEPKVIGFSVYKMAAPLHETAPPAFFRRTRSAVNSEYTNSRHISERCALEAAPYLILPTTFEPREEVDFTFRIFSNKAIKMKVLDDRPKMIKPAIVSVSPSAEPNVFALYEALFLQLADEHKTINVFELQDLLDSCLPNDYIKSCSSIDTCRQIVLTLGSKSSGRISLSEFKELVVGLKRWQLVFKKHALEKMGVLRAERLRDALRDVGFTVPERVLAALVLRYMRKDGMLRFGDFVSALMHLQRAYSFFDSKGGVGSDTIQMTLQEWLYSAFD